jgi:hypothetical protein
MADTSVSAAAAMLLLPLLAYELQRLFRASYQRAPSRRRLLEATKASEVPTKVGLFIGVTVSQTSAADDERVVEN